MRISLFLVILLVLQSSAFCGAASADASELGKVSHVIHISIDGLRGDLLESLVSKDPRNYSNFRRFVTEGATTFNARNDYTDTSTLPNHTTILTARPASQPEGGPNTAHHGYLDNSDRTLSTTLHNSGNENLSYVPSVFDVVHDAGLSTALYGSKSKFVIYDLSYDAENGAPDTTGPDNGRDKIDHYVNEGEGKPTVERFLKEMQAEQYNYAFVHDKRPDHGHHVGWGSEEWNDLIRDVDRFLGALFALVESEPGLAGDTALLLTADHGGEEVPEHFENGEPVYDHGDPGNFRNYTIPVLVW
ncbi:MAG: alkaline phosphatase family protein, partial [Hyphomicrobiaceae bacterium]|nr:alkaline phosphatase family protein [Hyphomicrobiaceae bacterium]